MDISLLKELEDRRCALTISTTGPTDLITWNGVWEVGSELKDVCARQGKQGRVINLGMSDQQNTRPRIFVNALDHRIRYSYCYTTNQPSSRRKLVLGLALKSLKM